MNVLTVQVIFGQTLILWRTGSKLDIWEVEGVVQQAFLHVFRKVATYRGKTDGEAWSWINTITRNHTIDVIRQKNIYGKDTVRLDDETCANQAIFFDEQGIDQRSWLESFFSTLSPREQLLLNLLQDGVSHTEIAAQLGVCLPRITQIKKSIQKKAHKFDP